MTSNWIFCVYFFYVENEEVTQASIITMGGGGGISHRNKESMFYNYTSRSVGKELQFS